MKKILSLLLLALVSVVSARAADVTLFSTDFSSSDWSAYTSESPITAKTTVNGIFFNCADYVANNALQFNGGGNINANRFCAIHVKGVNQSVKIVVENNKSARVKYLIKEENEISSPESNIDPGASNTTTIDYNMTGTGDELTFYFYQQGSGSPNIVKSITITTPDASTVTTVELSELTVNGTSISNLDELLSDKSLTIDEAYVGIPIVKYNVKTSVKEGDADPVVTNQLVSATLAKADDNYTTTLTAGTNSYTLTFTNVTTVDLLDVTNQNDIVVALTKDNFISYGYLATSTQNWNENKTYGEYKGDFYNMSGTDRNITIKVKGATSFEVFVQNTNPDRGYTIKVDEGEAQTINHGATGIEGSGIIKCGEEETTITIAGTGNSVYPVYFLFNPTPAATSAAVTFDTSLTDGSKYYATFSADHALDFTNVEGVKAYIVTSYTYDGWSTFYANVQEVTKVPANTGVLLAGDEPTPTTYTIPFTDEAVELEAENKLLVLEEATSAGNLGYPYTLAYAMGTALFQSAFGDMSAGTVYLSLTEDEDYDAYGYVVPKFASDGPDEPGEVVAMENIAALKAIKESSTVELTLTDAIVTQSKYDEDNFIDAIVIEDASGALRLTNQQLSTVLQVGQTLNGKITVTVNVTDYSSFGLGVYYNYGISDASITSITYAAYGIPGDVTITDGTAKSMAITDETIYEWMYDYDWRYVSLANVSFTTQNEVGGNGVITIEDFGLDITVVDADRMITEWPADGSIVTVEGFLYDYIGGSVDFIFQPTKITVAAPTTVAVTVGEDGYATFSCDKALDFTDSGIKAYVAVLDGKNITFSEVQQVSANTGVLLYAEGGATKDINIVNGGALGTMQNNLVASTADMDGTALTGCYILSKVNDQIGFYKASSNATLAAGKAYFPAAVNGARIILPAQEATSIRSIETAEKDAEIYNLQGQRVKKAAKGLNIINGHKVIIR